MAIKVNDLNRHILVNDFARAWNISFCLEFFIRYAGLAQLWTAIGGDLLGGHQSRFQPVLAARVCCFINYVPGK